MTDTMTHEAIIDHLIYSGAYQWPWWHDMEEDGQNITVIISDPQNENKNITKTATIPQVLELIDTIIKEQRNGWEDIKWSMDNDDFDADSADLVLQHLAIGGVAYA